MGFDDTLRTLDLGQNVDKAEHILHNLGKGSIKEGNIFANRISSAGLGQVHSTARYLGNHPQIQDRHHALIESRHRAARAGFYSLSGYWTDYKISLAWKATVFRAVVYQPLVSGLTAEVFTETEYLQLEKVLYPMIRRCLGPYASRALPDGTRHQLSNSEIMVAFCITSVETELRAQRIKWLYNIIYYPDQYAQLRANRFVHWRN